ncbi:MAG: aromatic amino acid DMT transporter YddG [bacterium]
MKHPSNLPTALGLMALILWSSTIGISRSLAEEIGAVRAASWMYLAGGSLGCLLLLFQKKNLSRISRLPKSYLFWCGGLFIAYLVFLFLAIGYAATRQQTLEVGLINYLWPALTLLLSIPILKKKASPFLAVGILMALSGIVLAMVPGGRLSFLSFAENFKSNSLPYLLSFGAAAAWALYSNLSRRLAGDAEGDAVPLFLLLSGLALWALSGLFPQEIHWTPRVGWELAYMAVLPGLLAYSFWDAAMRKGNATLLVSLSYYTPFLSTLLSCLYLGLLPGWNLWAGCLLLTAGAIISHRAFKSPLPRMTSPSRTD